MKILVINPNTSNGVTEKIASIATKAAGPQTQLDFITAPYGVPYIATRAEALIGGQAALEILADHKDEYDAAVLAAFGDPGLGAIREMIDIPVVGLAEASLLAACPLGRNFSIVSFSSNLEAWYQECVEWHKMEQRLASIRMLNAPFSDINSVQSELEDMLVDLAQKAISEDKADVIITAGAPLAGLASKVRDLIPVPVVEGVAAAVKMAETMCVLQPRTPRMGAFAQPARKPSKGLPPSITRLFGGQTT